MKKAFAMALAAGMVLSLAACGTSTTDTTAAETTAEETTAEETTAEETETETEAEETEAEETEAETEAEVMDYAAYEAAAVDDEVTVKCYVQAHQSWWDETVTVYAADQDGAYFIYGMACSEEDAEKLVPGTAIVVTGYKSEWSGEVEIADATFEFGDEDDTYLAEPVDVTDYTASDLAAAMNQLVSFNGATVVASNEDGDAYLYNWDGSGSHDDNSDLYFNVDVNGTTYTFTVESYLCDNTTDVYAAVEGLNVGDVIDVTGFMYWYEGPQLHTTAVTVE